MSAFPEQRMSILTLGVADLAASTAFYENVVGLTPFMREGITFFNLGGVVFGLWDRDKLHKDIGVMGNTCPQGACPNFAVAYNTRTADEVDEIFGKLRAGGAQIVKEPHKADWGGYGGYFVDPDGYAWEVVHNPHWPMDESGHVTLGAKEAS